MKFISRTGADAPLATIDYAIRCFEKNGESGPHSTEGWLLSHILNHCIENKIAFSLVCVPDAGYYIKQGVVQNIAPPVILKTLSSKELK